MCSCLLGVVQAFASALFRSPDHDSSDHFPLNQAHVHSASRLVFPRSTQELTPDPSFVKFSFSRELAQRQLSVIIVCVIRNCSHLRVAYFSFRIRNVKKEYNEKPERVKALQGKEKNFFVLMFLTKKNFCFLKIQS